MQNYDKTFAQAFLDGEAQEFDVNDWVEHWHEHYEGPLTLNEYLGLTLEEYQQWVHYAPTIGKIIKARLVE